MASIPPDVTGDILSHLTVKDLIRFRCVAKFFRSLIDSPDFIKLHHSHSQKTNTNTLLYGISERIQFKDPKFSLVDLSKSINHIPNIMVNRPPALDTSKTWNVVGCCNGLVALHDNNDASIIVVWNPLTGKSKEVASCVPDGYRDNSVSNLKTDNNRGSYVFGFGYDPNTDDYTLVRIPEIGSESGTLESAVYSLKTNSWKEIVMDNSLISCPYYSLKDRGVLVNNALHWWIYKTKSPNWWIYDRSELSDEKIIAFDLVKKEFHYVPVLDSHSEFKYYKSIALGVLDGCLVIFNNERQFSNMWVMKEYGVKDSWNELVCCNHLLDNSRPISGTYLLSSLIYSRGRDKVLLYHCGNLVWYDLALEKQGERSYGNDDFYSYYLKVFTGSLIAPDTSTDEADFRISIMKRDNRKRRAYRRNKKKEEEV